MNYPLVGNYLHFENGCLMKWKLVQFKPHAFITSLGTTHSGVSLTYKSSCCVWFLTENTDDLSTLFKVATCSAVLPKGKNEASNAGLSVKKKWKQPLTNGFLSSWKHLNRKIFYYHHPENALKPLLGNGNGNSHFPIRKQLAFIGQAASLRFIKSFT